MSLWNKLQYGWCFMTLFRGLVNLQFFHHFTGCFRQGSGWGRTPFVLSSIPCKHGVQHALYITLIHASLCVYDNEYQKPGKTLGWSSSMFLCIKWTGGYKCIIRVISRDCRTVEWDGQLLALFALLYCIVLYHITATPPLMISLAKDFTHINGG